MAIVFDQETNVDNSTFYVKDLTSTFETELNESFGGQANGICGAAIPGMLFLITGLHAGRTRVTIQVLDAPPAIGDEWEDVVEISFRPESARVALLEVGKAT